MDVKTVMDTWTLQMGFPVVTVRRNYQDKTATVTQQRFLVGTSEDKKKEDDKKYSTISPNMQTSNTRIYLLVPHI